MFVYLPRKQFSFLFGKFFLDYFCIYQFLEQIDLTYIYICSFVHTLYSNVTSIAVFLQEKALNLYFFVCFLTPFQKAEERRNWTKEQKQELKQQNENIQNEYGYCMMDGHREKVGNFKIEPPGLFRGRGDHPKQGKLKHRICPEDIIINIGK